MIICDIMDCTWSVGEKIFGFWRDFYQVFPKRTSNKSLQLAWIDHIFEIKYINCNLKNMRVHSDKNLANYILKIGNGEHAYNDDIITLGKKLQWHVLKVTWDGNNKKDISKFTTSCYTDGIHD